ncbi:MAG: SIMPL domain-containing protein [Erythrobacter sp.]
MIRVLTIAAAASLFAAAPASIAAEIEIQSEGPVVELSVYESVTTDPDIATISAGVSTEAPTAVEAMRQNAVEMRRVIDRIKALGVDDKDIQTTGINLNASYDYDRDTRRNVFRGYQVSNRVSVKLREIDEVGQALDALVSAGATDLNGPSFSIENDDAAKDEARKRAVERATARANAYARMLGYSGVRVLEVNETIRASSGFEPQARGLAIAESAADSAPVQPGQVSTGVNITIKYEMVGGSGS